MTELEQRLTNEFGKLAEQYERDQRRLAGAVERLEEQVRQLAGQYAREQTQLAGQVEALTENMQQLGAHVTILTNAYEGTFEECERNDQRLQRCCEGYERTHSLIHGEADQKRKAGDRRDRVEGRIESLIQGRVRSRGWDFSR